MALFILIIILAVGYHFNVYGKTFEIRHNTHISRYIKNYVASDTTHEKIDKTVLMRLLKIEIPALLYRFKTAFGIFSLAYPPFFLGLIGLFAGWKNKSHRDFIILFVILFLTTFPFFANYYTYGFVASRMRELFDNNELDDVQSLCCDQSLSLFRDERPGHVVAWKEGLDDELFQRHVGGKVTELHISIERNG